MTRETKIFAITAVAGGCAALLLAQVRTDNHADFRLRIVTTMTSATRTPAEGAPTVSRVYFGRKDGSTGVRTTEVINQRPCTTTTIWDTNRREETTYSDCVGMKSTIPFQTLPRVVAKTPVQTCVPMFTPEVRFVGTEAIQGLKVEKFQMDTRDEKSTLYIAPDLGCMTIRGLHYWKDAKGAITSTTFDEPVEVKVNYHDPSLFEQVLNFREVLPSERRNAMDKYFRGVSDPAACLRRGNDREDKRYAEGRRLRRDHGIEAFLRWPWRL